MGLFTKNKTEKVRKRTNIDTIVRVLRIEKKLIKKANHLHFFSFIVFLITMAVILNLSFFGTVAASTIKTKTDILKTFKNGTYLVVFQNNSEMRPTGGFIGSFATVTFSDYKVQKIDFNTNIYKLDDAFTAKNQVAPPAPLAVVSHNHWALRDSNFAIDYPTAAKDIQWFFAQESGQKVDGVIAVNASVVQDLLKMTGPVYLAKYQTTISADNFFDQMAEKIEKEYFYDASHQTENEPKTILKDLMPILMNKAFSLPKVQLVKFVLQTMNQKQILFQSNNDQIEQAILANNWGGEIQSSNSDYLAINNANITDLSLQKNGGAKTSLKVKESVDYRVSNLDDNLVANLALTRSHTGSYAWPDGTNVNWTRILVPVGSTLQKAELNGQNIMDKIQISEDAGKTTFSLWLNTNPQTSNVLNLSYKLPISTQNYHLLVQKQPGNLGDKLFASFNNQVLFNGVLDTDKDIKLKNKK